MRNRTVAEKPTNSTPGRNPRKTADYLYQAATIIAALLLVLSAAA